MSKFDSDLDAFYSEIMALNQHCLDYDRHRHEAAKTRRLILTTAYRAAQHWSSLYFGDADSRRKMQDIIKSSGLTIDEWLKQQFRSYLSLGEYYQLLIHAVHNGMTLDYLLGRESAVADFVADLDAKKKAAKGDKPDAPPPDKNSVAYWRGRCRTLESENHKLARRVSSLEKRLTTLAGV